ncbi:sensor histidine kinase [Marinilabilia sp.]
MKSSLPSYSIILILLIIGVAFSTGWAMAHYNTWLPLLPGTLATLILVFSFLRSYRKTHQRINYFFEAIKNEDSALSFSKSASDPILTQHLEKTNQYIQRIKIKSRQREQYFSALIEHIDTGILSFDEKGFVHNANTPLKRLLGLDQFTHLRQLEKVDPRLANIVKTIRPNDQKMVTIEQPKSRRLNLLIKSTPFTVENQNLMLTSLQDINDPLSEKELDAWMKLIRVLTHEIMNAIAPVTSLSENLKKYFTHNGEIIKPEQVDEKIIRNTVRGLNVIEEQGKGLISFVKTYRRLTRLPKPELSPVPVKDLIEKAVVLNKSYRPNIEISVHLPNEDIILNADEKMVNQVLVNLLKNASEALEEKDEGKISVSVVTDAKQRIIIEIKDNGPGIPPELLDEIFVPFFTTRDNGSGIGLSLSRQIMRLHKGKLNVRSVVGKETVFSMEFPGK